MKLKMRFLFPLLIFCAAFLSGATIVRAESRPIQVTDEADILSDTEERDLSSRVEELEMSVSWDIILLSIDNAEGKDAQQYAEEWFDTYTTSDDGVICMIDTDNSEMVIRTFGEAIHYLTDARLEAIFDEAYFYAQDGDFAGVFESMLKGINDGLQRGIPDDQYVYDVDTGKVIERYSEPNRITVFEVILAIVVALAAGGITIGVIIGKYRLKWGGYQYSYRENGTVELTQKNDRFVNQIVTHRRIPHNNSGGAGNRSGGSRSTTRIGAGGRRSGGGSRKF